MLPKISGAGRPCAVVAGATGWYRSCSWNISFTCRACWPLVDHTAACLCALSHMCQGMRDQFTCLYLFLAAVKCSRRWSVKTHPPGKPPYLCTQVTTAPQLNCPAPAGQQGKSSHILLASWCSTTFQHILFWVQELHCKTSLWQAKGHFYQQPHVPGTM